MASGKRKGQRAAPQAVHQVSSTRSAPPGLLAAEPPNKGAEANSEMNTLPVESSRAPVHTGAVSAAAPSNEMRKPLHYVLIFAQLLGLGASVYLTRVHLSTKFGAGAFDSVCDFGSGFDCSKTAGSEYAALFGVLPIALMAIPVYSLMLMLILRAGSLKERALFGLISGIGLLETIYSAYLIYISAFVLHNFCLFCLLMCLSNILTLLLPPFVIRGGFLELWKESFGAVRQPRVVFLSALNLLLVSAIAWGGYTGAKDSMVKATAYALMKAHAPAPAPQQAEKGGAAASSSARPDPNQRVVVPLDDSVPVKGPANAKVTLVVYDDFQCPFCRRLVSTLEQLSEAYPKDLRIAMRHFPMNTECNEGGIAKNMHPDACRAAMAAECAHQQGAFWPYYLTVFKNSDRLKQSDLLGYGTDLGLNTQELSACMKDPQTLEKVREDTRTGGALGVSGTPTLFVNGRRLAGALSFELMSALIDAELKGENVTMAELSKATPMEARTGRVDTLEMIRLEGPEGPFEIDAVEAVLKSGRAAFEIGAPVATQLTWFEADAACEAAGKRLCTEGEWLTACQNALPIDDDRSGLFTDDRLEGSSYPYGDLYRTGLCLDNAVPPKGSSEENPPPPPLLAGMHPDCRSKAGVFDLTGSVREWVGTVPNRAAFMGGAFFSQDQASCSSRNESVGPWYKSESTGFRCCRGGKVSEKITHPGRQVGQVLSPFKAKTLEGKTIDSSSFKGRVTLVTFFASWCSVCKQELPKFNEIYPELKAMGAEIIAINTDDDPEKVRQFLQKMPLSFPVVLDLDGSLHQSFDAPSMPTSFIIDPDLRIVRRRLGYQQGDEKRLIKTVEDMKAGK